MSLKIPDFLRSKNSEKTIEKASSKNFKKDIENMIKEILVYLKKQMPDTKFEYGVGGISVTGDKPDAWCFFILRPIKDKKVKWAVFSMVDGQNIPKHYREIIKVSKNEVYTKAELNFAKNYIIDKWLKFYKELYNYKD